mmetsp:Transcript_33616/g.34238  ORF Transcript_33616/g.34238 Transcript_33616/m.34238 type:complete len:454 (+) Transcript_33616:108-1469(+)
MDIVEKKILDKDQKLKLLNKDRVGAHGKELQNIVMNMLELYVEKDGLQDLKIKLLSRNGVIDHDSKENTESNTDGLLSTSYDVGNPGSVPVWILALSIIAQIIYTIMFQDMEHFNHTLLWYMVMINTYILTQCLLWIHKQLSLLFLPQKAIHSSSSVTSNQSMLTSIPPESTSSDKKPSNISSTLSSTLSNTKPTSLSPIRSISASYHSSMNSTAQTASDQSKPLKPIRSSERMISANSCGVNGVSAKDMVAMNTGYFTNTPPAVAVNRKNVKRVDNKAYASPEVEIAEPSSVSPAVPLSSEGLSDPSGGTDTSHTTVQPSTPGETISTTSSTQPRTVNPGKRSSSATPIKSGRSSSRPTTSRSSVSGAQTSQSASSGTVSSPVSGSSSQTANGSTGYGLRSTTPTTRSNTATTTSSASKPRSTSTTSCHTTDTPKKKSNAISKGEKMKMKTN